MKVALACGGTGGHIFPGLATAQALRARGHEVSLWLAGKAGETVAIQGWDGPIRTVAAQGLPTRLSWDTPRALWRLLRAIRRCGHLMEQDRPDVVLAMGSYASVGPSVAARRRKIPLVLHEANVIPGRAIGLLSRLAEVVAVSFEETRAYLRGRRVVFTGMPIRAELAAAAAQPPREGAPEGFTILITGGSGGARRLNELAAQAIPEAFRIEPAFRVIHLARADDADQMRITYAKAGVPHTVYAFCHDMAGVYQNTDLAISRAGASTCAELLAFGIPALLVPYPHAVRNHQTHNARAMERIGAAHWVEESDCEAEWLAQYLIGQFRAPERLHRMRQAARRHARLDAADALAQVVEKTGLESSPD